MRARAVLENLVDKVIELGREIEDQIDDNFLTYDESNLSRNRLKQLIGDIDELKSNHETNKEILNKQLSIASSLNKLIGSEVVLEDIKRIVLGDHYKGVGKQLIYLDYENQYHLFKELDKVLQIQEKDKETRSQAEQSLLELVEYIIHLQEIVAYDALYPSSSKLFTDLENLINTYHSSLYRLTELYRGSRLRMRLEDALDGIKQILEHENMGQEHEVKLKGFISSVDGLQEINELLDTIESID